MIGGIIDFRFFLEENIPEIVVQKFQSYIGKSAIPPFWSFGYHQSRWGYKNITYLQNVTSSFHKYNLPLDTIWSDIDYMLNYEDFTIDETKFPLNEMKDLIKNVHYIPIMDAGILIGNSTFYTEGQKRGVFIKDANGSEYWGKMRPGRTTFVDFLHPNASKYWSDMLDILHNKV